MKTKVLVLLFALMTNVIVTSAAVVEGTCGPNLTWSLNTKDSTLTIEGTGMMTDYTSYQRAPWETYRSYIAYLSLGDGVQSIGSRSFIGCNMIRSISLPNSIKSINSEAFQNCAKLSSVSLGDSILRINNGAFQGCDALIHIELPQSLTSIGTSAFSRCKKLESVNLGGTRTIGNDAFYECTNLATITPSDSLVSVGDHAFASCAELKSFTFPSNFKSIDNYAFYHCSSIVAVELPDGMISIGDYAFEGCSGIENLILPNSITTIGECAFEGCTKISSVIIPEKVTFLKRRTFGGCESLVSIEIHKNITYVGKQVFYGCKKLNSIVWNAKKTNVDSTGDNVLYFSPFYNTESQITSVIFGDEVTVVPKYLCYRMWSLTSVSIPDSVTEIGTDAFAGCANLSSVSIGSGILNIGSNAFGKAYLSDNTPITSLTVEAITPPAGGLNCGINPAICTLYVPEESVELYSNTLWWEDFLHIRAIGSTHTITFVDMDGTILSTQTFDEGETIIPPTTPQHEGYTFIGWDTDLTNITSDITITAQYTINRYRIQFIDWDGTIIKTDSVEYLSNIVPPANPTRIATAEFTYTFAGWTPKIVPVIGDATYTAQYNSIINKYTITFKNDDGSELCADEWDYGTMPYCEEPTKEDDEQYRYTFAGWSPDIVVVKVDATYTATYTVTPKSQGIEDVLGEDVQCKKLVRDGQIFILRGEKVYTLQGQEVK